MFKVCTRIIGLAAVLATLGAASVASADSGPTPEAIATLRTAGGLDPYDTSKDTHVWVEPPTGPTWEAIAILRAAAGLDPYDTSKDTYVATNRKHKARHARHRRHHR
jgi:hypothetical protein